MPEITVNARKAENLIDFIPDELDKRFPAIVERALIRYRGFHRVRRLKGPPPVIVGTRKGLLGAFGVYVTGTTVATTVGKISTKSYVAIEHEEGRRLRAREGKSLAIPFSSFSKVERKAARRLLDKSRKTVLGIRGGKRIRRSRLLKLLFVIRNRAGKAFLAQRLEDPPKAFGSKRVRILFHLQREAQLKPRLDFISVFKNDFRPQLSKEIGGGVKAAVNAAARKARAG
jgi:hypothetical protein